MALSGLSAGKQERFTLPSIAQAKSVGQSRRMWFAACLTAPGTGPAGREPHLWTLGVSNWLGTGHSIDAVRAESVCTGRQAQNHRAHRILRPLPNRPDSLSCRDLVSTVSIIRRPWWTKRKV